MPALGQNILSSSEAGGELERLRQENARLAEINREANDYIRKKVDSLLAVIGTKKLRPEELDDRSLIEFDPIGVVAQTFQHVLENLRDTNQKLSLAHNEIQTVFETVGAAVMVLDPLGKVVSYNQKVCDLVLGADLDIRGKKCREHVCHNNTDDKRCIFDTVMQTGNEQCFNEWNLNGRSFDVIGRPMFDEAGKIARVVLAYHDVSARREAQSALLHSLKETREAHGKIHGILSSAADGILVTDADGKLVLINRRAEELTGLCMDQLDLAARIDSIQHGGLAELLRKAVQSEDEIITEDLTFQLPEHSPCICQARISVIKSSGSDFNGCIVLLHDVTEQRAVERMKSEFVSTAAHELRTPLATITGYAELLLMDNDFSPEQQTEFLQHIQLKAERLGDIVSDLLDISRIESGEGIELEPKPNRPEILCEEAIKSFRLQSPEHSFVQDFSTAPGVMVHVDRFAINQVLENLLSNAVKYSPAGGEIRISGRYANDVYLLSISDQGIGMTSEQVARVYDKFYRVDATNTAISGTGLGMTIVKHLVEAQSGQVSITSVPGRGTTVAIALPVVFEEGEI